MHNLKICFVLCNSLLNENWLIFYAENLNYKLCTGNKNLRLSEEDGYVIEYLCCLLKKKLSHLLWNTFYFHFPELPVQSHIPPWHHLLHLVATGFYKMSATIWTSKPVPINITLPFWFFIRFVSPKRRWLLYGAYSV